MDSGKCLIWQDDAANTRDRNIAGRHSVIVSSPRAAGDYEITQQEWLALAGLDEGSKARLTTLLVDLRNQHGEGWLPRVTVEMTDSARIAPSLAVHERAERLLRFIGNQSKLIGDTVRLNLDTASDIDRHALAWSESTTIDEVQYLVEYLIEQRWVQKDLRDEYALTVDGHRRIAEVRTNPDSAQVFVAMWFGEEMDAAYEQGVKPAIDKTGYKPLRIDEKLDVIKIDDEIVAEIRRSRFMIADFTQGEDGARGGVYFEAGFAFGLGIPVIYTCREDMIEKIHFDTRQYHHTPWKDPKDLGSKLEKRILALIGEGPAISSKNQVR